MNKRSWDHKNVLITGFEGFLGSNLTKALLTTKAKVIGLDLKTRRRETIFSKADHQKIAVYRGSVANFKLVQRILRDHSVDVIFHLAAEAIVEVSRHNPLAAFESNIKGTWTVLEAVRQYKKTEALIVASSDKAYGSHKKLPYKEDAPLIGDHPYDVSKSCADLIAYTYFHTYGLPVAVTRCGNIYGPGDFNFSRVVPDAIRCAILDKEFLIRSDGKFTRDYIFIDDIIEGYLKIGETLKSLRLAGQAFNFSNESPLTVIDLVKKIYRLTGSKPAYRIRNQAQFEIKHQYLSSRKAAKVLGWKSKYNIVEGLTQTIKWYKNYLTGRG